MRAALKGAATAVVRLWTTTPRLRARVTVLAGIGLTGAGGAAVYLPAGLIAAGVQLTAFGLFIVTVPEPRDGARR